MKLQFVDKELLTRISQKLDEKELEEQKLALKDLENAECEDEEKVDL